MKTFASVLALVALATPVSLHAEDPEPLSPDAKETLQCAMWASYYSIVLEEEDGGDVMARALDYFVGRFEGLTGMGIDQFRDEQLIIETTNSLEELTPVCTARMEQYAGRELQWGKTLDEIGDKIPEEPGESS